MSPVNSTGYLRILLYSILFFNIITLPVHACPDRCICFRTTVRCMHLHLGSIPAVPENTTVLDLRFNKIRTVEPGIFSKLKNLHTLLLNDNLINSVKDGTFKGLNQLKHLYLYKNKIKEIEERAFDGMPKLEQLYLHYNKIEKIRPNVFGKLHNLQRLFLHENKIQHLIPGTFSNLRSLKRLRLDGNALVCDCGIMWFKKLMSEEMNQTNLAATCQYPENMQGKSITDMTSNDVSCNEPRIIEDPHDVEVDFGSSAIFTCKVDGDPQPDITWMLNSNEIDSSNPKYTVQDDGTLVVSSTSEADLGIYECMAKSPYGISKSKPAKIVPVARKGKPEFRRKPMDQVAREGDTVQLECETSLNELIPLPTITWTKDDLRLRSNKTRISPEGTLTISSVTIEDTAKYRCIVESENGRISAQAYLTVNAPPRIIIPPERQLVKSGERVEMRCVAYGNPAPIITWFKNGSSIQPTNKIKLQSQNSLLIITHVDEKDIGLYTCLAQSIHGNAESNGELRVRPDGPRPPAFTTRPYPVIAPVGSSVEFPCQAQGDPHPTLEWTKDGEPMIYDSRHKVFPIGSLRLYNISRYDKGTYQCKAANEFGEIIAAAPLIIEDGESNIDDNTIIRAVESAEANVDRAINSTISTLFSKKASKSPSALMRLFRYPDEIARSAVRAADIYENTLLNIRKHIASGLQINATDDFFYEDLLTLDQLQLIARLSGCMEHQTYNCSDMCFHSKYRTIEGTCNNLEHPYWGASHTGFRRILRPIYENGFSQPVGWNKNRKYNGFSLPSARLVSTTLIRTESITQDEEITHMVMQWGQFLDHDLDHAIPSTTAESWEGLDCKKSCDYSPPCFPMEVPHGDSRVWNRRCMDFIRSSAICGSGVTSVFFNKIQPREQINQLTAFIDGSQVYGFTTNRSILLRDYSLDLGLLRTGIQHPDAKPLLPIAGVQEVDCRRDPSESDIGCFLAGDIRVNEQVSLVAIHTIWMREHNRIAEKLKEINPHWTGEIIFNEARKIVGAEMQHITYKHWLPHILGKKGMELLEKYEGYNPNINPAISNEFATAALRFGHSLINPTLARLDHDYNSIPEGELPLGKAFFAPWRIIDEGGVDALMRGMIATPAKKKMPQENLNMELTERLFTSFHAVSLDLASMNIQRSRDHGIPFYNEYRKYCNLTDARTFDDLSKEIRDPEVRDKLQQLYGHPGNIDIWVGGILEDQVEGARVGPLFRCLLIDQFKRIRDGDRFWYEYSSTFKPSQLTQIKQSSLAKVLCDNGDNITHITRDVFILPRLQNPSLVKCEDIPGIDLRFWYECEDCENSLNPREDNGHHFNEEAMEERVEGLEGIVAELQKTVKNLKRRMKIMSGICKDHKGKLRKDGEGWQQDDCTYCECQETTVKCTVLTCPKLTCEVKRYEKGKCCPVCK